MYKNSIAKLEIELVSSCNARCPFCFRQNKTGHVQPNFPGEQQLDPHLLAEALADPALKNLKEILFCGNYGDPLASKKVVEALDVVDSLHPKIPFAFHTNGGLGSENTWLELGRRASGKGRFVTFSIDGLEDTNSIYRRGVSWPRVMQNVKTFIAAGGRADWKFVVFPHNKHQVEEARKLSQDLGFAKFRTVANYNPELSLPPIAMADAEEDKNYQHLDNVSRAVGERVVECRAVKEGGLFLDFQGRVWPCCWIAGWKYASGARGCWHQARLESFLEKDFNLLSRHRLSEILNHSWFLANLPASWVGEGPSPTHPECLTKCGRA